MKIIFVSPESHEKCYLNLALLDDANNANKLEIVELVANNKNIEIKDEFEPGPFSILKNEKTVLELKVKKNDYFASEVKIKYENR